MLTEGAQAQLVLPSADASAPLTHAQEDAGAAAPLAGTEHSGASTQNGNGQLQQHQLRGIPTVAPPAIARLPPHLAAELLRIEQEALAARLSGS